MREPGTRPQFEELIAALEQARDQWDAEQMRDSERALKRVHVALGAQLVERGPSARQQQLFVNPRSL